MAPSLSLFSTPDRSFVLQLRFVATESHKNTHTHTQKKHKQNTIKEAQFGPDKQCTKNKTNLPTQAGTRRPNHFYFGLGGTYSGLRTYINKLHEKPNLEQKRFSSPSVSRVRRRGTHRQESAGSLPRGALLHACKNSLREKGRLAGGVVPPHTYGVYLRLLPRPPVCRHDTRTASAHGHPRSPVFSATSRPSGPGCTVISLTEPDQ